MPKKLPDHPNRYVVRKLRKTGVEMDIVMKKLPTSFGSDGFFFSQILRASNIAMFSKTKPGWDFELFEVVIIQVRDGGEFPPGNFYPAREAMPKSSDWGTFGWSYCEREAAFERFRELQKETEES